MTTTRETLLQHLLALIAVAATLLVVGLLESTVRAVDLPAAILLYLVPIVLAASRWGRGPAVTAALAAILGHDLLFVDPRGTFSVARADEALGLFGALEHVYCPQQHRRVRQAFEHHQRHVLRPGVR